LERLDRAHKSLDESEIILYVLALSFIFEGMENIFSTLLAQPSLSHAIQIYTKYVVQSWGRIEVDFNIQFFILLRFVTWRAFNFWSAIAFVTDSLLLTAFVLRILGLLAHGDDEAAFRLHSFQVLSCVSPLIW
jgi:hypothetical protein